MNFGPATLALDANSPVPDMPDFGDAPLMEVFWSQFLNESGLMTLNVDLTDVAAHAIFNHDLTGNRRVQIEYTKPYAFA